MKPYEDNCKLNTVLFTDLQPDTIFQNLSDKFKNKKDLKIDKALWKLSFTSSKEYAQISHTEEAAVSIEL